MTETVCQSPVNGWCLQTKKMPDLSDLQSKIERDLYPYLELVHKSPLNQGYEFNPLALIRAVNGLHSLGKEQALAVLRRYFELIELIADIERSWEYNINPKRIFLIARLLFVRNDSNPQMPKLLLGLPDVEPSSKDNSWPLFPLAIERQIPFFMVQGYSIGGRGASPLPHLDYCQQQCQLRHQPLEPETSPIVAVESLLASERFKRLIARKNKRHYCIMLYLQALRAMAPLYVVSDSEMALLFPRADINFTIEWNRHARAINQLSPRWQKEAQQFVSVIGKVRY